MKWQSREDAIKNVEQRTGVIFDLELCPHCGHRANLCDMQKDPDVWGGYRWEIMCSSSHCCARVCIVADGWAQELDGNLNSHIKASDLYEDRLTQLRRKWNRRV
jgi:hypothetical protein